MSSVAKISLKLMLLTFIAALCLRVSITSIGPVIEIIALDLKLTRAAVSLVLTIPIICMGICALLAQPLSAKFGLERTIAGCILMVSLATFLRTLSSQLWLLALGSFLIGTSIAISGPLISGFVRRYFSTQINKGMMLYSLGISCSGMFGTIATIPLMRYFGLSWQEALELWALPIAAVGIIWAVYFIFKKSTKTQEIIVKLPWKNKRAWTLLIGFGLQSGTFYTILPWLMPYLIENGADASSANFTLNVFMFIAPLGSIIFPILLARFSHAWVIFSCGFMTMIALLGFALAPNFMPILMAIILGLSANGGMFILILTLPFYETKDVSEVASWTAMILSIGYLISAITPTFFGYIRDVTGSYQSIMWGLLINASIMTFLLTYLSAKKSVK